jgi:hypothetical protein
MRSRELLIVSIAVLTVALVSSYSRAQEVKGRLLISVRPEEGTEIYLSGELIGKDGVASEVLAPGKYEVKVVNPKFQEVGGTVSISENQITVVEVDLARRQLRVKGGQARSVDSNITVEESQQSQPSGSDTTGMFSLRGVGGVNAGVGEKGKLTTYFNSEEITFRPGNGFSLSGAVRYGITSYLDAELGIGSVWGFRYSYDKDSARLGSFLLDSVHGASFSTFPIEANIIGKWPIDPGFLPYRIGNVTGKWRIGQIVPYGGLGIDVHLFATLAEDITLSYPRL